MSEHACKTSSEDEIKYIIRNIKELKYNFDCIRLVHYSPLHNGSCSSLIFAAWMQRKRNLEQGLESFAKSGASLKRNPFS